MNEIREACLESDHGQFVITDLGGADLTVASIDSNPLLTFDADAATFLSVMTGASYGPVGISSVARTEEPSPGPEWEEIVDVSVTCASGLVVAELMDEGLVPLVEGGGHYRVRVSARGRDHAAAREREAEDEEYDAVLEHFLVEAWPAPPAPMTLTRRNAVLGRQPDASPSGGSPQAALRQSAGLAACAAIGRDLDGAVGARRLSGATGSMNA